MKKKIWATLNNVQFKGYCLDLLIDKFQKIDRNINIYLAIASSGSIAAWAIWDQFPMVWGIIIASTQVITVVKPYIPYFKYVKELKGKLLKIENLNIELERLWYYYTNKKISDEEIEARYFELKKEITEVLNFQDDTILTVTDEIEEKANNKMRIFLKTNYNLEIQIT
jgi:hypothetical protein